MAEPHPTDRLVRELAKRYGDAYQRTMERLTAALQSRRSPAFYQSLLRELEAALQDLRRETASWAPGAVESAWQAGAEMAARELARAGISAQGMTAINRPAVRIATQNLMASLDEALLGADRQIRAWVTVAGMLSQAPESGAVPLIGRRVGDVLRQAGLEATARKLTEGLSVSQMRKGLLADLTAQGITSVTDQAGRKWSLRAYADLVARTTSREAYTQGSLETVQRAGHDLVRASVHWPTCPICAARQGRVYSISGRTPGWPVLASVGPTPWHPSCGHSLAPFVPELRDREEVERLRSQSNHPLDADPRTRAEREAYERSQRINALRRERQRLLAQRKADAVPLDQTMQRWARELEAPGLDPERRRELEAKLADRADMYETRRRERLRQVNAELRSLAKEQRDQVRELRG